MKIKVLGSGCPNCKRLEANAQKAVEELNLGAVIEKVTDMDLIMSYGIISTPALVINEQVVSYGRIPDVAEIKAMLVNPEIIKPFDNNSASKTGGCNCGCKCGGKC
ncbi:MAG: thioredoxin family protein [Patescibacteria group bacterium]|nr:thioredoxin family protein [Patescibacteria group bacterium]MDD5164740.1 thioredoxin family protein [Patescibacteria group bacterium]MDD5534573.1 thioredoxin family protein [Patescibacteria group bacterium]